MRFRYYIVDVFSDHPFGGNQLAVLPDAAGLSDELMQKIAREFNFAESTFVLAPQDQANTRRVRIFTPLAEIPFAGHPNIGTAFALAAMDDVSVHSPETTLLFEEQAGLVPVAVRTDDNGYPLFCELTAPQNIDIGAEYDCAAVAAALGLRQSDIVDTRHAPVVASAGLPFLCIQIRDRHALADSRALPEPIGALLPRAAGAGFLLYTLDSGAEGIDIRARMYAPLHGVPEDPATGSAAAALAGLLATLEAGDDTEYRWRINQGMEMGRPSLLEARANKTNGKVHDIRVGGKAVMVADGHMQVPI